MDVHSRQRAFRSTDSGPSSSTGEPDVASLLEERKDAIISRWRKALETDGASEPDKERLAAQLPTLTAAIIDELRGTGSPLESGKIRSSSFLRERFVAILAHDLRNPLNAITLSAGALARKVLPGSELEVRTILRAAGRMARMIDDLLDLARGRLTREGIPIRRTVCDGRELCEIAAEEMRRAQVGRRVDLEAPEKVLGHWDRDRLLQLFSNLLANAVAYSPEAEPVKMSVSKRSSAREEWMVVAIHNEGEPIAEALLPVLFDPFRRGDHDSPCDGGLGLGLYIVDQIVAAHRGTIDVVSSREGGTTFTVSLPTQMAHASPPS